MKDNAFHIHTFRCGHAENIKDEKYIEKAIELGFKTISFTDHAPFPNNIFGNRMKYEQLEEYISTLQKLKEKYKEKIDVKISLEVEYLPSFYDYYKELLNKKGIDFLILGQHFYETSKKEFCFQEDKENYAENISNAIVNGMKTGLFPVCAHPDRAFRFETEWTKKDEKIAKKIIDTAIENDVILEINLSSKRKANCFWEEFWNLVPNDTKTIVGYDAHSLNDLI